MNLERYECRLVVDALSDWQPLYIVNSKFQSAYRAGHSAETALLKVMNDVVMAAASATSDAAQWHHLVDHGALHTALASVLGDLQATQIPGGHATHQTVAIVESSGNDSQAIILAVLTSSRGRMCCRALMWYLQPRTTTADT